MSDILETESNAVITAKKTFNQFRIQHDKKYIIDCILNF